MIRPIFFWHGAVRCFRALATLLSIHATNSWYRLYHYIHTSPVGFSEDKRRKLDNRNARLLAEMLMKNGGTWIKAGQFLSTRPDMLPMAYIDALTPLQNQADSEANQHIESVLESAYGLNWKARFLSFEMTAVYGASIAVVHKAVTKEGVPIALKIKRNDIDELFAVDISFYRFIAYLVSMVYRKFDFVSAVDVFLRALQSELDFEQEARNVLEISGKNHIAGIRVAELIPEYSCAQIVALKWVDGYPLIPYLESADHAERTRILSLLQNSFIQQIMRFGLFQGDPHPGNFLVDHSGNVVLLDFGLLNRIPDRERLSYANILLAVLDGDMRRFSSALSSGGIKNLPEEDFSAKLTKLINSASMTTTERLSNSEVEALIKDLMIMLNKHAVHIPDHFLITGRVLITLTGLFHRFEIKPQAIEIRQVLFEY